MNAMKIKRWLTVILYATKVFWPVVAVVGGGVLFFLEPIVSSIASTPHPSLVYTIFAMFIASIVLVLIAFVRYMMEESLAIALLDKSSLESRLSLFEALRWRTDMEPVYNVLLKATALPWRMRQAAIESELYACEEHLVSRLSLPGFLGGALVGLGLVGTFVGLLGSLDDLGNIFSALLNVGAKNVDPVAMFGDMIRKLQAPIRSMGTAFVASLYGLLGSLVIGFVLNSAHKTATLVGAHIRALIKHEVYDSFDSLEQLAEESGMSDTERWRFLFDELRAERQQLQSELVALHQAFGQCNQSVSALAEAVRALVGHEDAHRRLTGELHEDIRSIRRLGERLEQGHADRDAMRTKSLALLESIAGRTVEGTPRNRLGLLAGGVILAVMVAVVVMSMTHREPMPPVNSGMIERPLPSPVQPPKPPDKAASVPESIPDLPVKPEASVVAAAPVSTSNGMVVRRGQTLGQIAAQAGLPVSALLQANPQLKDADHISEGMHLAIPPRKE